MGQFIKDLGVGFLFVLTEILFFQHLAVYGVTADPILFYLLYLIGRYDRIQMLFMAAILGFFQDAFFDLWGLNMFAKTLLIFITFTFIKRRSENQLLLWQIIVVILIVAVIHNIIFVGFSSFFSAYTSPLPTFFLVVGSAVYTAALGGLVYIFKDA